jgi:uncharacterized protein YjbJ (UPF0337 family)
LQRETGFDDVEDAASKVTRWTTKKRFTARADNLAGHVKEGIGRVTGDVDLADEGVANQAVGTLKDKAGILGHAVGETIHDLNR